LDTWSKQTQFKPNQTQFPKIQNELKLNFNKGLQKKRCFLSPNKQTQFLQRPKMNVSNFLKMTYENKCNQPLSQNKPNPSGLRCLLRSCRTDQTQFVFLPSSNEEMFISKTLKKSCSHCRVLLQCFTVKFDKPGERKAECSARPKLRNDPMNLLGIMPAKEGKIYLKHSFYGSAFCFCTEDRICETCARESRYPCNLCLFYGIHC